MLRGFLRSCPRCQGDVFVEEDPVAGSFLACLQCGHTLTNAEERVLLGTALRAGSVA